MALFQDLLPVERNGCSLVMEAGWGDPINVKATCRLMLRAHIRAQVLKGKALRVWVLLRSSHVMNVALLIVQGHGRVTRVVNPFSVKRCLTMLMMLTRPVTTFDLAVNVFKGSMH